MGWCSRLAGGIKVRKLSSGSPVGVRGILAWRADVKSGKTVHMHVFSEHSVLEVRTTQT